QAGKRVAATVSLIDLLPTLTRMTQIGGGEGGQGHDRSGLLRDASAGLREGAPRMMRPDVNAPQSAGKAAWQEHDASYGSAVKWNPEAASIRVGRHKLISTKAGQPPQLFDLVADPGERNDLATTETELVTRMSAKLDERRAANIRLARLGGAAKALPESVTERLRNLGYLDEEKSPQ
ncbi:MAG TPA: hypothetical protein VEB21_18390, partial [Terriglobales bacterium]|nr:hypothetical protein [Terriglobales bacterium]